jgi:hypothetical protein
MPLCRTPCLWKTNINSGYSKQRDSHPNEWVGFASSKSHRGGIQFDHVPGQSMAIQIFHKRIGIVLLHVPYARPAPETLQHHLRSDHGRNTRGIRDGLGTDFTETFPRDRKCYRRKSRAAFPSLIPWMTLPMQVRPLVVCPKSPGFGKTAFKNCRGMISTPL